MSSFSRRKLGSGRSRDVSKIIPHEESAWRKLSSSPPPTLAMHYPVFLKSNQLTTVCSDLPNFEMIHKVAINVAKKKKKSKVVNKISYTRYNLKINTFYTKYCSLTSYCS